MIKHYSFYFQNTTKMNYNYSIIANKIFAPFFNLQVDNFKIDGRQIR